MTPVKGSVMSIGARPACVYSRNTVTAACSFAA
nr:hypothetical protein HUO10_004904 [Paraburkholderia busanensis]